jgi:hypothetical protein
MGDDIYGRLAAPFEVLQHDVRGGVEIDFITGEQCASRLNEVLGVGGWNFRILHQDIHAEADEAWVLGELDCLIDGQRVIKQQFGSQKIKRSRSTGAPLDLGFDLKGAGTDCLKKCATMVGVALYLYDKEARQAARQAQRRAGNPAQERQAARVAPGKNNAVPAFIGNASEVVEHVHREVERRATASIPMCSVDGCGKDVRGGGSRHGKNLCAEHFAAA